MKFVEKVKSVIHKYYIKRVLRRIRKSFSLFGYPLEDVSDEEITKAIEDVVKQLKKFIKLSFFNVTKLEYSYKEEKINEN